MTAESSEPSWAACSGRYGGPAEWPNAQRLESVAAERSESGVSRPSGCVRFPKEIQRAANERDRGRAGGQRHCSRVRQLHRQHQMTETPYYGMYIDDIWLAISLNNREFHVHWVSAQLDQLIQAGNLQPAPLALHDLGGVWGQYHLRWPPHFVDLRALNSMFDYAPLGYSGPTLGLLWTTHLCGCQRLWLSVVTLHQQHWDRIDFRASALEEAWGGLHRRWWCVKDETLTLKGC